MYVGKSVFMVGEAEYFFAVDTFYGDRSARATYYNEIDDSGWVAERRQWRGMGPKETWGFLMEEQRRAYLTPWGRVTGASWEPEGAVFRRPTKDRSFLGGPIWEFADAEGRSLGEANAVPANTHGERSEVRPFREPGRVVMRPRDVAEPEGRCGAIGGEE